MKLDWFKDMELFVAVAKAKSFIGASAALEIPHSTISRRIALFEKSLGYQLLNRTTRHVALTQEGEAYLARIEKVLDDVNEIHRELHENIQKPHGRLRISLPPNLIELDLATWIAEFAKMHPLVSFDIDSSPVPVNLITEKFDIAIRIGSLSDSTLRVRRLVEFHPKLFASESYVKTHGLPKTPEELQQHSCLCLSGSSSHNEWILHKGHHKKIITIKHQFWFNDPLIGDSLVKAGLGIAQLVASKNLIPVLDDWQCEPIIVSLVTSTRMLPAKTRYFIEFLCEKIKKI